MRYALASATVAQSNTALIAAQPEAYVHLVGVYISSDTAMTVDLVNSSSHTLVWRQYLGANGGQAVQGDLATSAYGEGLDYVSSTAGNVFLHVTYDYEG